MGLAAAEMANGAGLEDLDAGAQAFDSAQQGNCVVKEFTAVVLIVTLILVAGRYFLFGALAFWAPRLKARPPAAKRFLAHAEP